METKLFIFSFLALFLNFLSAATVTKVEGIEGSVQFIESASNDIAYIVTENDNKTQSLYCLYSNNSVRLITDSLNYTLGLMLNSKNEPYAFDVNENSSIRIWKWNPASLELSNPYTYFRSSPLYKPAFGSFFDNNDNLFFNSETGISILRYNENEPVNITRLDGCGMQNPYTHAVHQDGTVYMGIWTSKEYKIVRILKEEIDNPDPYPEFINNMIDPELTGLSYMTMFNGNLFIETNKWLLRFIDDSFYEVRNTKLSGATSLHVSGDRLFFQTRTDSCYASYVNADFEVNEYLDMGFTGTCLYYQTFDSEGDSFIGVAMGSEIHSLKHNESLWDIITVPNGLTVYGITASENGDVWLLAYNLYVVPRGSKTAIRVPDSPHVYVAQERPMKARKNTNQVIVGSDRGVYIAEA